MDEITFVLKLGLFIKMSIRATRASDRENTNIQASYVNKCLLSKHKSHTGGRGVQGNLLLIVPSPKLLFITLHTNLYPPWVQTPELSLLPVI